MRKFFALLRIQLLARYADLKPSNLKKITDPKEKKKARSTILPLFCKGHRCQYK